MAVALHLEVKTRDGTIYSRPIFPGDEVEKIMDSIQEEENLVPGEILRNVYNMVNKPLEGLPVGEDKQVEYILTDKKVIWRSGPLRGMSKFRGRSGYCHIPPECIKEYHDCHVLQQYGGWRSNEWSCNCGRERTEGGYVCCALVYFRGLAQWELRIKIVGLLKMNKKTLMQQVHVLWLASDEEDEMRANLWNAGKDIRRSYEQGILDINGGQFTGVTQSFADAVLQYCTPNGAPLDELLKDLALDFLVGRLNTVSFTGQMWPQIEQEIRKINREHQ